MRDLDFIHRLERETLEKRGRVRAILQESGRDDLVQKYDQDMRDLDLGLIQARGIWHSISQVQRKLLMLLSKESLKLQKREGSSIYDAVNAKERLENVAMLKTVRPLLARDLLQCEGGVFNPEAVVTLTERGKFVVEKGQSEGVSIG